MNAVSKRQLAKGAEQTAKAIAEVARVDRRLGAVKAKRSKFGNVQTTTGDGVKHASKKQSIRWVLLRQWEREGKIRNLRREVRYDLIVNGHKICWYKADHVYDVPLKNIGGGHCETIVEDVKSAATKKIRTYIIKKKLMLACHGITIREV